MNNKIILSIKGGLGNQIFQILATLNLCKIYKITSIVIYTPNLNNYDTSRAFDLDFSSYKLDCDIKIHKNSIFYLNKYFIYFFKKINFKYFNIIDENNYKFNINSRINIIDGYFQSNKFLYSSDCLELFKKEFTRNYLSNNKLLNIFSQFDFKNDLGVHIRGGDFLTDNNYIRNTPLKILREIMPKKIIIFTDDKMYSMNLLKDIQCQKFFISDYNLSDIEEFILITNFYNFIITNSTYSITAVILGLNDNKQIWCPSNWLKSEIINNEFIKLCKINNFKFYL
jgi:hypothetical protein